MSLLTKWVDLCATNDDGRNKQKLDVRRRYGASSWRHKPVSRLLVASTFISYIRYRKVLHGLKTLITELRIWSVAYVRHSKSNRMMLAYSGMATFHCRTKTGFRTLTRVVYNGGSDRFIHLLSRPRIRMLKIFCLMSSMCVVLQMIMMTIWTRETTTRTKKKFRRK